MGDSNRAFPRLTREQVLSLRKTAEDVAWAAQDCPPDSPLVVLVEPQHLRSLCEEWLDLRERLAYVVSTLPRGRFTWPDGYTIDATDARNTKREQEVSHAQVAPSRDLRAPPE